MKKKKNAREATLIVDNIPLVWKKCTSVLYLCLERTQIFYVLDPFVKSWGT